ncbi:MAG: hypothetical protein ACLFT5_09675 [Desulfovermiculus sp.]
MELAIHLIADLIQHLKEENQKKIQGVFIVQGCIKQWTAVRKNEKSFFKNLLKYNQYPKDHVIIFI